MEQPPYDREASNVVSSSMPFYETAQPEAALPNAAAVWPPPIAGMDSQTPAAILPLKPLYQKVQGNVSDVQEGALQISQAGINIVGRALPRAEITQTILVIGVIISLFIAALAYIIIRYACLQPFNVFVNWNEITEIIVDKQRKRFGFSYNGVNFKGKPMQFSVCTRASDADIAAFEQYANTYAPTVTHIGHLRSATSIVVWLILASILIGFIGVLVFLAFGHR